MNEVLAAGINLGGIQSLVIQIAGILLAIILIVRLLNAYTKRQWGEMVGEIAAVVVIGFFVWSPETSINFLKDLTASIFGG